MAYTRKTIVSHLQKLNDNWNDKYWIFVAAGELHLMRHKKDGQRAITADGGADQRYISKDYPKIIADGGDW